MNSRFFKNLGPFDIEYIANHVNAEIISPSDLHDMASKVQISNVSSIENANNGDLTFLNNTKYLPLLKTTKATVCVMKPDIALGERSPELWCIIHPNPYYAYAKILDLFYESKVKYKNHVEKSAYISPKAKLGNGVYIGHNVVIEDDAEIGDGASIGSNSFIGHGVTIGSNTRIDSNVTISYASIGNDVVILPGARIGQDGFGFATEHGRHKKILHIGSVIIEDDVEIGANSAIDRGSVNDTIIKKGARIDNLVQLGHNVEVGVGSVLVAQVGVAGSSSIGNYCALGGQVGVAGHVHISDKSQIAGQSGIIKSINEVGGMYFGTPAVPIREWQKQNIALKKLVGH
ncbi:MAG: UDP-3-O-[3-hydroxymyristoyl] glucosamine N-acyltransferase [Pseudomonadota bacterium]|jgi:UDP-3-O-[3-hydroxymyristoyl] glucosamine N-acyltransferase